MTPAFKLDLDNAKLSQRAKYVDRMSFRSKIIVLVRRQTTTTSLIRSGQGQGQRSNSHFIFYSQPHTHRPMDVPGPLKWSIKVYRNAVHIVTISAD